MSAMADRLERLLGKLGGRDAQSSRPDKPAYSTAAAASTSTAASLFRKASLPSADPASPPSSPQTLSLDNTTFPQPSFIRPSAAKMVPREDRSSVLFVQRPRTAARSMSVPGGVAPPPGSLRPVAPRTGAPSASVPAASPSAAPAPAHSRPPVSLNARHIPVAAFDSRRSSCHTNTSSATLSSGCSTICSTISSCNSSTATRHSFVEAFPDHKPVDEHCPRRASSLLQRRDLSLAPLTPLASFDDFQIGRRVKQQHHHHQNPRDSAITINSGEISPATVLATPVSDLAPGVQLKTGETADNLTLHTDEAALHELPPRRDCISAPLPALPIVLPQNRPMSTSPAVRPMSTSPAVSPPPSSSRRRARAPRRPTSLRYKRHLPHAPMPSSPSAVLMEPNLGDFLSLSDDDIAEDAEDVFRGVKVPKKTRRRVGHAPSQPSSFLALLPGMPVAAGMRPRTPPGDARMAAAFKMASIASRYQFDLAYIATVWPKNMALLRSSAVSVASAAALQSIGWPSSPASPPMKLGAYKSYKSHARRASISKLDAQFLAAFGLATAKTPHTLSAPMHARILNAAQQWSHFDARSDADTADMPHGFAQGLGCAFYQGHAPVMTTFSQQRYERRPSTADDCDADTEQDDTGRTARRGRKTMSLYIGSAKDAASLVNNRGIVFVAYRRRAVAAERAARGATDDLTALHRDVAALVHEIHDAHVQQTQADAQCARPDVEDVVATSLSSLPSYRQSRFAGV